ncbi:MAG: hypothetical protein QXO35_02005 [Candidatus Micrarchaeia archaeon]
MEELTYDELMRIHAREKGSRLSAIPSNFYQLAGRLLASYDKSDPSGMREYNNVLKMIKYIYQRRLEKIFNYILSYDKEIELPPEMLDREREIYNQIVPIIKKFNSETDHELVCQKKECNDTEQLSVLKAKSNKLKIILLKDVDEFVSANGSVIGPFKQQTEVELTYEDAEMLIQIGVAKRVE